MRNGPGTMIMPDGKVYSGIFKDDALVDASAIEDANEIQAIATSEEPKPIAPAPEAVAETEPVAPEPEQAPSESIAPESIAPEPAIAEQPPAETVP